MTLTSIIKTLSNFRLFEGFSPEEVWEIFASGKVVQLERDETLISPGITNKTLYLLIDGELGVILEKDGVEVAIRIPPGECLGEMSLVAGHPTSARAIARRRSRVLLISEDTFWNKLATTRTGVQNLLGMMARRLQRNNDALIEKVEQQVKYQLMQKDLETAAKIQSNIVPNGDNLFPNRSEVDAFALINQARDVGGDFYDAMILDQDLLYFAVGDVSGKGIPAALFMMRTLTSLRMLLSSSSSFDAVIPAVNNWLARDNEDMMFVSLFAGILNVRTGMLRYVNAGHNPPYASLNGEKHQLLDLPEGTLLGLFKDSPFPVTQLQLNPGDSLVLYTDGITEAKGAPEDMFDFNRTAKTLNRKKHNSMKELVHYLEAAVEDFVGTAPQVDDYTIFALQYWGGQE